VVLEEIFAIFKNYIPFKGDLAFLSEQFIIFFTLGCIVSSLIEIGLLVLEKTIFFQCKHINMISTIVAASDSQVTWFEQTWICTFCKELACKSELFWWIGASEEFFNDPILFCIFVIISPFNWTWPFIWKISNSIYPRMYCTKSDWNWPADSGEVFFFISVYFYSLLLYLLGDGVLPSFEQFLIFTYKDYLCQLWISLASLINISQWSFLSDCIWSQFKSDHFSKIQIILCSNITSGKDLNMFLFLKSFTCTMHLLWIVFKDGVFSNSK
jgi:hypothetical protein